jgi:antitoxin MazE
MLDDASGQAVSDHHGCQVGVSRVEPPIVVDLLVGARRLNRYASGPALPERIVFLFSYRRCFGGSTSPHRALHDTLYRHLLTRRGSARSIRQDDAKADRMRVHVKKWGNSASVRIPATIMAAAKLSVDQAVDVKEEGGRIIIEPIQAPVYDLDDILDRMTPETFHEDIDFGPAVGHEVW